MVILKPPRCKIGKKHDFGSKDLQKCKYCGLIKSWQTYGPDYYDLDYYVLTDENIVKNIESLRRQIKKWENELELNRMLIVTFLENDAPRYALIPDEDDTKIEAKLVYNKNV